MTKKFLVPKEVSGVIEELRRAGHHAYIVGGCTRDVLRGAKPKDWDVATSAKPEEIMAIFPESFYENKFLTVTVKMESEDPTLKEIEVTTFRAEGKYTDKRHPDEVRFAKTIEEDLGRRDFTVNAIAVDISSGKIPLLIDPFAGQDDLQKKIIRAVGEPAKRFEEDALRMMRAVRLSAELDFAIDAKTHDAIQKHSGIIELIAKERVRDELVKLIMAPRAKKGIEALHECGLLKYTMPELEEGIGVENRPRIFTIWEHNLKAFEYGVAQKFSFDVRLSALLHDVGKPRTKGPMKNGEWTYYGHDVVGSQMAIRILERLKFPRATIEKIAILIRWHLFKYDPEEGITDSSIRRLIKHVGAENIDDLVKLRMCDRMGMGVPKALPYRLRHFQFRVEKILREEEAPTPKMLKINGIEIMEALGIAPGPKIGNIISVLLEEVIDDPQKNNSNDLTSRVRELGSLSDEELMKIAEAADSKVELIEGEREAEIKGKYYVK